jgi:hypothetical protein
MAKDPATLWYWNDWHGGTITFTRHLKGCYMDLLHAQFNTGRLSLSQIKTVLGVDFGASWPILQEKFKRDENDKYYNEKAELVKIKRQKYSEGRRKNLKSSHMGPHMGPHMEAHMEIENENEISLKKKEDFLNNQAWKEQFCMAKGISMHQLEKIQKEWLKNVDLKDDPVRNYKSYFTGWWEKNKPIGGTKKEMVY